MIKKIIAVCGLLFSITAFAQETNASPYSYYGVGDLKFKGTPDTRAMGSMGIFPDSIHINLQNPASYSHLKVTTFSVAASNSKTNFKSSGPDESATRTTLDYLTVAIPFNKAGIAFGLMPYTAVGYKIQNTAEGSDNITRTRQFNGRGGINRVFLGGSYQVTPAFSIGADVSYNFGNIETKSIVSVTDVQLSTRETNDSHYGGVSFNVGATYKKTLNNKYDWITSATFTPASNLKSSIERELATITITNNGEIVNDSEKFTLNDEDVKMPARFTVGSGIGIKTKWFAGVEYAYQQSNELGNRFDNITSAGFEAGHRASVGGYYTPNYMSYSSYFSRITYRGGLKFEKTGLVVNNNSINDYALTFGASLPLGAFIGSSSLNIGFEWGRRGTTSANLIQENYFNMLVSLSLNDRWFIKRKYD
ncbi:hypothetical protein LRS05_14995 [Flavobacterium sp. J372]|uniref:hypothetical protein n=1 Tax=Flavobacterium sp. J372 TaxID=2898436 RepID=UPI0021513285|nr:hypothetical protein [Flavobacterium sp. J372]MCR5863345.1 hypothetical protein [Flavobacterium sp. J372]